MSKHLHLLLVILLAGSALALPASAQDASPATTTPTPAAKPAPKGYLCHFAIERETSQLAPYQSPTFRAISISHQTEKDKADRGTTVLHSLDQVKQLLLSRGVSPEQFGRALMEPMPPMIEHEDHGEKKR
jgi:hypothetical protein